MTGASEGAALLHARGLGKSYGALRATSNVCIDVRAAQIHALIGPNGAGKSTAIGQLSGDIKSDTGHISFRGCDVTHLPVYTRARQGLVRSYQVTAVFDQYDAEDNVAMAVQARVGHSFRFWRDARSDKRLREPGRAALARVGLGHKEHVLAANMGHAERRRLELAMVIVQEPWLLLLDEPMAGLGPEGTLEMTALLGELKTQVAMLLVEHDMDVVFSLADIITVLVSGETIASGLPAHIRENDEVRDAYLGETDA
jgi:branched-chain amino acid transport system ATP-binding protein